MNTRLLGLDALRGLAAIMVVVFHLGLPMMGAHLAVDFFFMLSGFVMARTYEERLRTGAMGPLAFMIKRYRRLWGWMALGTSVGLIAMILQFGLSGELLISFALMVSLLPALNVPTAPYFLNIPLWSIIYELVANIAHALGLARMNTRALGLFALACFAGLSWATFTVGFPWGGLAEYHWLSLFKVGASYTAGILIWRLWGDTPPIKVPFAAAFAALPLYCALAWFWNPPILPLIFVAVIAPLMMFGGMGARIERENHARLASTLGDISFPLYAVHFPVIMLLNEAGGPVIAAAIGVLVWGWLKREALRAALSPRPSASA
ncbi:MAG: acyltransferase [Pseudomonadota bacterium]